MPVQPPRISLFGLAEYMFAPIERRAAIVGNAMVPNEAAGIRYSRARHEIVRALRSPPSDVKLFDAAERFRRQAPTSPWDESDLAHSADALDDFRTLLSELRLGDRPPRHRRRWPTMQVAGVAISVSPDLVVRKTVRKSYIGAIKVRFGKTHVMSREEAKTAATILRYYLKTRLKDPSFKVKPSLCQIVAPSSGQVMCAPQAYKRTMATVEKACRELSAHWVLASLEAEPSTTAPPHPRRPSLH